MRSGIKITVSGSPVAKGRGRVGKTHAGFVTVFTPSKTRKYENEIKQAALEAIVSNAPYDEAVAVSVVAYMPIPASFSKRDKAAAMGGSLKHTKKPDADNILKAALDGINKIIVRDDSLFTDVRIRKQYSESPRLEITVWPLIPAFTPCDQYLPRMEALPI